MFNCIAHTQIIWLYVREINIPKTKFYIKYFLFFFEIKYNLLINYNYESRSLHIILLKIVIYSLVLKIFKPPKIIAKKKL